MLEGPSTPVGHPRATALSERQVTQRTEKKTHHLRLGPRRLVAAALVLAVLVGWSGFATLAYLGRTPLSAGADGTGDGTAAYEARLTRLAARNDTLEQALAEADRRRDLVTERLGEKQARLVEAQARLREAEAEFAALRGQVAKLTAARYAEADRAGRLKRRARALETALAEAQTERANLDTAFERFTGAMEQVIAERDTATRQAAALEAETTRLAGDLNRMEDRQERLIARISEAARTTFAGLESMFAQTDLDLERILAETRRGQRGAGGPYVPISEDQAAAMALEGDTRVAALVRELETVDLMRMAAQRLPFGLPVEAGRLTSNFGPRSDPHGRGHAMHEGIDYAGPRGTPIHATADGIVTFSGWQRGYGKLIKIRHAFGFETVYAHLHRARVKVGQRIARGDRIGDMGNTGRSTGTHVHYEIRLDTKPVNPSKFIEAARDVL